MKKRSIPLALMVLFGAYKITLSSHKEEKSDIQKIGNIQFIDTSSESSSSNSNVVTPEESQSSSPKNIVIENTSGNPDRSPVDDWANSFETYRSFDENKYIPIRRRGAADESLCPCFNKMCCRNTCIICCIPCLLIHVAIKILCC